MPSFVDLTGMKFGRITPIRRATPIGISPVKWECLCDCGKGWNVTSNALRSGGVKSCGCFQKEGKANAFYKRPEYMIYKCMKARCTDTTHKAFHNYGGRGIKMCVRWQESFETFYSDMGPKPSPNHTLDRINANGNYTAKNCRWLLRSKQNRNKRMTRYVIFQGQKMPLVEAVERSGTKISSQTVRYRLEKLQWTLDRALTEPYLRNHKNRL